MDISVRKDAKRCITFQSWEVRRDWTRMMPVVQGWCFHRLQDVPFEKGVLDPVPVDWETLVRIHYEPLILNREDMEEFLDEYADEYPDMTLNLLVIKVEFFANDA